jgi:hypothetical protein
MFFIIKYFTLAYSLNESLINTHFMILSKLFSSYSQIFSNILFNCNLKSSFQVKYFLQKLTKYLNIKSVTFSFLKYYTRKIIIFNSMNLMCSCDILIIYFKKYLSLILL